MATPEEQAELSRARQGLASTRRSLRDTRETVNNIIPDDKDDTNQLLADLAAKEKDLLAQIGDFEARIAELEALADRSISDISRREGISRISPHEEEAFVSPLGQTSPEVGKRSTEATSSRPSRCSAASVTKLCLPQLCEPSDLQSHYEAIEHTLVEAGAADYGEEGRLSVHSEVKVSVMTKFLSTLTSVRSVHKRAMAAARVHGQDWNLVRNVLSARFCRRSVLREMYDEKLRALTYGGVKQIDDFLEAASEVFHTLSIYFPMTWPRDGRSQGKCYRNSLSRSASRWWTAFVI